MSKILLWIGFFWITSLGAFTQNIPAGFLHHGDNILFPIDFYEHPKDDTKLKEMAEAGVNMVHCHNRADLDQAASVGLMGVVPLPLQNGATEDLKNCVSSLQNHPALAAWEGPDEIVWNFTAASMLYRNQKVHTMSGEWWKQTPNARNYSEEQAKNIIPKMREAVAMIRDQDGNKHPLWINEAMRSDVQYVRQYLDFIDITGCDIYPVKKDEHLLYRMGQATDYWQQTGLGKPVWMVLQAFAWSELGDYYGVKETAYPTFEESRFMAYDVIAHGAKGILYWGSDYLKSEPFRQSLYALTAELAALQPFLSEPDTLNTQANLIEVDMDNSPVTRGVRALARRHDGDWLLILVNEDERWHMGTEIRGLEELNGASLHLLYGDEHVTIQQGRMVTRMGPYATKVFATKHDWEASRRDGRDYAGE